MIGVYVLTCKSTGKCYVGASKDVQARVKSHRKNSFREQAFYEDVLEECSIENLQNRGQHWIDQLETLNPSKGYNRNKAAKNLGHRTLTDAQLIQQYNSFMAKRARGY